MPNTAKQEAIRKAWLEFLSEEDFKKLILDEEGFSNYQCRRYIHQSRWNDLYSRFTKNTKSRTGSDLIYRPKSLQSIENNNGWIRIESEEDLPTKNGIYWTLRHNSIVPLYKEIFNDMDNQYWLDNYTHFQPIAKPENPIY